MLAALAAAALMNQVLPPEPCLPIPSPRQIAWHRLETYAFVHFSINTFTDREWGEGDEDPKLFAPTALDVDQWVRTFKAAGMKMVILTAKHHDGLCMWPSKQSTHTIAASGIPNRDILGELSKACKKHGLKLGVYLSPWDRNHPKYGTPEYNDVFVKCLEEVLSQYGPVYEVWFDGANGEGPNGKKQVYDWPRFHETVRRLQPDACMFSDAGPDVRWVGNESGFSAETCWGMIPSNRYVPGTPHYKELTEGSETGDLYIPAECDVSIRPGWFYHASQDDKVKTVEQLVDLYFKSVGQNANFLLNVPPDRRGLIHENDSKALLGWRKWLDFTFGKDLAKGAAASSDHSRGEGFNASAVTDGNEKSYWAAPDGVLHGEVTVLLGREEMFDVVELQEYVELGQRVKRFYVDALTKGMWQPIASGTTIGYKRLLRLPNSVTASGIRVRIEDSRACPTLRKVGLFASPDIIRRELEDRVRVDQDVRSKIDFSSPKASDIRALEQVDADNIAFVRETIGRYGWMGASLLTSKGAHDLWLLVQHADSDPSFQSTCLELMRKQVAVGEASGKDFAYLTDRVLRAKGNPQRYGTQLSSDGKGGFVMQDCEDAPNLDTRRATVGLGTMAEYMKMVARINDPKQKPQMELLLAGWPEIPQASDGGFTLGAKGAKVLGSKAAYEEATEAIGYWVDVTDQVGWVLDVRDRGSCDVYLTFACDPASPGSTVEVSIGADTLQYKIPSTGGWTKFDTVRIGRVALMIPGLIEARVQAKSMPQGAVMNLRKIELKRIN